MPFPHATRFARLSDLTDREALGSLFGPVQDLTHEPMASVGYSGSRHERLVLRLGTGETLRFVHKRTNLEADWTAYRTRDVRGREPALLSEPEFAGVWNVFECPYVAFASEGVEVGLLMWDLSAQLLPDRREPLELAVEDALLGRIAELHARFWGSSVRAREWLSDAGDLITLLGPGSGTRDARRPAAASLQARVQAGWALAIPRLPVRVVATLFEPAEAWSRRCAGHPRTLVHGDVKVANFAPLRDGRVAAFDWETVGSAPASIDLGWYLAVNASRLARPKEAVIARYRSLLQSALGQPLDESTWAGLERLAVLSGATMLLWSKALNVESKVPGAEPEWAWWEQRLTGAC
jgi:hypothetical protein